MKTVMALFFLALLLCMGEPADEAKIFATANMVGGAILLFLLVFFCFVPPEELGGSPKDR